MVPGRLASAPMRSRVAAFGTLIATITPCAKADLPGFRTARQNHPEMLFTFQMSHSSRNARLIWSVNGFARKEITVRSSVSM